MRVPHQRLSSPSQNPLCLNGIRSSQRHNITASSDRCSRRSIPRLLSLLLLSLSVLLSPYKALSIGNDTLVLWNEMPFSVELTYDSKRNSFSLALADPSATFFSNESDTTQSHRISLRQSAQSIALVVKNYESSIKHHSALPALSPLSDISLHGEKGKTFITLTFRENHQPRVNWNEGLRRLLVEQGAHTTPRHVNTHYQEPSGSLEPIGRAGLRIEELSSPVKSPHNEFILPRRTEEQTNYPRAYHSAEPHNNGNSRRRITIEPVVAPVTERDFEEHTPPALYMRHPSETTPRTTRPSLLTAPQVTSPYSASGQPGRSPLEQRVVVRDLLSEQVVYMPSSPTERSETKEAVPVAALAPHEVNTQHEQVTVARNTISSPRVATPPQTPLMRSQQNVMTRLPKRTPTQRNAVAAHHQILTRIEFGTSPQEPILRLETTQWPEYQIQQISPTHLIVTLKGAQLGNPRLELPTYAPMNSSAVLYAKARQRGSDLQIDIFMEEGSPRLVSQARENALIFTVQ